MWSETFIPIREPDKSNSNKKAFVNFSLQVDIQKF